jgi:hypothetical protein
MEAPSENMGHSHARFPDHGLLWTEFPDGGKSPLETLGAAESKRQNCPKFRSTTQQCRFTILPLIT